MKKIFRKLFYTSIAISTIICLSTSCTDEKDDNTEEEISIPVVSTETETTVNTNTTPSTNQQIISASINGTTLSFTYPYVTNLSTYFFISGQGTSNGLKLNIGANPTVGTHTVDGNIWDIFYYPNLGVTSNACVISSGSITISSYDATSKKVVGTFSAVGTLNGATYNITNGVFNTVLQ